MLQEFKLRAMTRFLESLRRGNMREVWEDLENIDRFLEVKKKICVDNV